MRLFFAFFFLSLNNCVKQKIVDENDENFYVNIIDDGRLATQAYRLKLKLGKTSSHTYAHVYGQSRAASGTARKHTFAASNLCPHV